jgi:hypothetical protein
LAHRLAFRNAMRTHEIRFKCLRDRAVNQTAASPLAAINQTFSDAVNRILKMVAWNLEIKK